MNKELYSNIENELTKELEKIYHKKFNKSAITFRNGFFDNDTIFVNCYLAQNENELYNGYKENDMFSISFKVKIQDNGTYLLENLSKSYKITPIINKWLAYERTELSFRKVNGTLDKVAKSFEKFVERLELAIHEDMEKNLIHNEFKDLVMEKCK